MPRYTMAIDVDRCTGCYSCYLACRDEHAANDHAPIAAAQPSSGPAWIQIRSRERGAYPLVRVSHVPVPCQQCEDAGCIKAAQNGAVYRRPDGIVIIDPAKAAGQRDIAAACPYGVVSWHEEKDLPQKCTFCAHLLDQGWKEPRCVEACPTQALVFGDAGDAASAVSAARRSNASRVLQPETGMKPTVSYLGLPGRCIAGELAYADRPDEPAAALRVTLQGGSKVFSVETDSYGDFEFRGLDPSVAYQLSAAPAGYRRYQASIADGPDVVLGTIALERS